MPLAAMPRDLQFALGLLLCGALAIAAFCTLPTGHALYTQIDDARLAGVMARIADPQPVDIAFFGSSMTMAGIDTPRLSKTLSAKVVNLAANWHGADLSWSLMEHLLARHKPDTIVVEASFLRRYHGHLNFKRVASMRQLLDAPFNLDYLANLAFGTSRHVLQLLWHWTKGPRPTPGDFAGGFTPLELPPDVQTSVSLALARELETLGPVAAETIEALGWRKNLADFHLGHQTACFRRMSDLCRASGTRLLILPLPKFRVSDMSDTQLDEWRRFGEVIALPKGMLDQPEWWVDLAHLNVVGARNLTDVLARELGRDGFHQP